MNRNIFYDSMNQSLQDCFHDIANSLTIFSGALELIGEDKDVYEQEMEYIKRLLSEYKALFSLFTKIENDKKVLFLDFLQRFLKENYSQYDLQVIGEIDVKYELSFLMFVMKRVLFLFPKKLKSLKFCVSQTVRGIELKIQSDQRIVRDLFFKKGENLEKTLLKSSVELISGRYNFFIEEGAQNLHLNLPLEY